MNYRHVTLRWSLEGLSPRKLISEIETAGFKPLYSSIVPIFCNFLCKTDPFEEYKQIKTKETKEEQEKRVVPRELINVYGGEVAIYPHVREELPSFGELFKHSNYAGVVFSLADASDQKDDTIWVACWNTDPTRQIDLEEPLEDFITNILKISGCDKPIKEITSSNTFSLTHSQQDSGRVEGI